MVLTLNKEDTNRNALLISIYPDLIGTNLVISRTGKAR